MGLRIQKSGKEIRYGWIQRLKVFLSLSLCLSLFFPSGIPLHILTKWPQGGGKASLSLRAHSPSFLTVNMVKIGEEM